MSEPGLLRGLQRGKQRLADIVFPLSARAAKEAVRYSVPCVWHSSCRSRLHFVNAVARHCQRQEGYVGRANTIPP